jgi:hypothetical protein
MLIKKPRNCTGRKKKELSINEISIKMRLEPLCPFTPQSESFIDLLYYFIDILTRIHLLACLLLNYHILRLNNAELDLPEFNQSFFYKLCTIVKDVELQTSFNLFRQLHEFIILPSNSYID